MIISVYGFDNLIKEGFTNKFIISTLSSPFRGVKLRSTWSQTRKANGDNVESRVKNTAGQWKAGKFMPLNMRGWSLNQYCLSKVWFKTHSVDLRVMDMNKITSSVESWLYADHLIKPEELVMNRPASYGGLGILNVKYKAMACLIKTFL